MHKRQIVQDGSTFYFDNYGGDPMNVTAPHRVWEAFEHDSLNAAAACRQWFITTYCVENDIEPEFVVEFDTSKLCNCGSGHIRQELTDARGISCGFVCDSCEAEKRAEYRPEIFTDPKYWADEDIEPESA